MAGQEFLVFNKAVYKDPEGIIYTDGVGIGTTFTMSSLHINANDSIILPKGSLAQRPTPIEGMIRYNTDDAKFEGYTANGWGEIGGGVMSLDKLTYISASNDSNLRFYTGGKLKSVINPYGNLGLGTSNPAYTLEVNGDAYIKLLTTSNVSILGDFTYGGDGNSKRLTYQVVPTHYSEIVSPAAGKSNFDVVVPGLYKVEPQNIDFFINGTRIGYLNSNINDFSLTYTTTNDNTDTLVNIVTVQPVSQSNSVSINIYPSYLNNYGVLAPGYVVQNYDLTYWTRYNTTSNIYYNNGNVGIGTTYAVEQLHVEGDMWVRYMYASNFVVEQEFNYLQDNLAVRMSYQLNPTRYSEKLSVGKSNFTVTVPGLYAVYAEDVEIFVNGTKLGYVSSTISDYSVSYLNTSLNTVTNITLNSVIPALNNVDIVVYPRYLNGLGTLKPGYVEQVYNLTYWTQPVSSSNIYYNGGNVGIGTTFPRAALEVNGHIIPSSCNVYDLGTPNLRFRDLYLSGNTIDLGGTKLSREEQTGGLSVLSSTGQPSDIRTKSVYISNTLEFTNNSFIVKADGNVGIGTTNPNQKLETNGNIYSTSQFLGSLSDSAGTPGYSFKDNSNTGIFHAAANTIALSTNGIERFRVDNNGNVGIGTTNPLYKLQVEGNVNITSSLYITTYAFYFTASPNTVFTNGNSIPYNQADTSYPYQTITSNGFRAPLKGLYYISVCINMDNAGTTTQYRAGIYRSSTVSTTNIPFANYISDTNFIQYLNQEQLNSGIYNKQASLIVFCNANDYIRVFFTASSANAGIKTYTWTVRNTNFLSGYLVSALP